MTAALTAACSVPADPRPVAPRPVDHRALLLTGHGRGIERVGSRLYAVGGFSRNNADPARDTRRTLVFDLPAGGWTPRASTHGKHAFTGTAVVDETLYALGGHVERYDAAEDSWTVLDGTDVLPETHLAACAVGTSIHVIGGYPAERSAHHVFDAATGAVTQAAPPPGFDPTDHLHVVAELGGRLHVVGGIDGITFDVSDSHHVFDGAAWRERARPPTPVWGKFAAHAVVDDALFVFEHRRGLRYDAAADTWSDVAPLPVYLAMPSTATIDGRIHVIGGMPVEDADDAVHVYDPATDTWTSSR